MPAISSAQLAVLELVMLALGIGLAVPVAAKADLAIGVSGAPSRIAVGENFTYTISVTNNGPDAVGDQWLSIWLRSRRAS
jgi:hypothetical protein